MSNQLMKLEYNESQIQLIRSQIAPKATPDELKLFLYQCQRTGLDALSRQIYAIHRWTKDGDKMTIQTSIDGFRVVAERSGQYAGQSEPVFIEEGGKLKCCKITVRKFSPGGQVYDAAVGVAYWDEYVQTGKDGKPSGLWAKMPHTMLSKVAEALALRKAFPLDLSGLYTTEEMQQADAPEDKKITIKEAEKRNIEIKEAIKDLLDCNDVDALKKLKKDLPEYVIKNESFKESATNRFNELTAVIENVE